MGEVQLYTFQRRYEEAEPLYIEALKMSKQLLGENHPNVVTSLNNLAHSYQSQGRYEAAEPLYIEALEIAETILGENHPNTNTIRENLNYAITMRLIQMPEAELKEIVPLEVFEQILELKKELSDNQ